MRWIIKSFFCLVFCILFSGCNADDQDVIKFENGQWFNGHKFESKTLYSVNGVISENYNELPDSIIDLKGGFAIPPFGDAHTHNLADPVTIDQMELKYLRDGIFYVQVMTNQASQADSIRDRFSTEETIDVKYANGGLTSTLGHPHLAYETSALNLHWSAIFSQRDRIQNSRIAENDAYWFLDSTKDVELKWDSILKAKPDLIKIYLINTDRHKELFEAKQMGQFGLSEDVAQLVVKKAHKANLKVYAHVENAYDFRVGLNIGVDGFGHLPGYSWDGQSDASLYRLTDEDLHRTKEQNVVIIPTVNFARVYAGKYDNQGNASLDSIRYNTVNQFLSKELERLHEQGVHLALGSDQHGETSILEANYLLKELNVFNRLTTLKLLSENTPKAIYPNRKIGYLKEGHEASFLVLNGNPLDNWSCMDSIYFYMKQGKIINVQE
jgi:imidazolonepropionase-like amidohydrolase